MGEKINSHEENEILFYTLIKAKNNSQVFRFSQIKIKENFDPKKALLLRKNAEYFQKYICSIINHLIRFSKYLNELKEANILTNTEIKFNESCLRNIRGL